MDFEKGQNMNLKRGFRITTWVLSVIVFIGFVTVGIYDIVENDYEFLGFFACTAVAFAGFAGIWLIYWIIHWLIRGFHKIGKTKILKIIKWAVIIFFASILFHLADYVVHKTTKVFEEKLESTNDFYFQLSRND